MAQSKKTLWWGLGLEHEFSVGKVTDQAHDVVDPVDLLSQVFIDKIDPIILSLKKVSVTLPRPVIPDATIEHVVVRKMPRASKASPARIAEICRALDAFPLPSLLAFYRIYCSFVNLENLSFYFRILKMWQYSHLDEIWKKAMELRDAFVRQIFAGKKSKFAASKPVIQRIIAHYCLKSRELFAFIEACGEVMDGTCIKVRVNSMLHLQNYSWVVNQEKKAKKDGEEMATCADIIASVYRVPVISMWGVDDSIEIDSGFFEVKSLDYERATVDRIFNEVKVSEDRVVDTVRDRLQDPSMHVLPYSGYSDLTGSLYGSQYVGSFHTWFTLPHNPETMKALDFMRLHAAFASRLQWMEPLLLASCTTGDPRAIGNGVRYPRANMRGQFNDYAGIGTSDVCSDMKLSEDINPDVTVNYHISELAFSKWASGEKPASIATHTSDKKYRIEYIDSNGALQSVSACRDIGRQSPSDNHLQNMLFPVDGLPSSRANAVNTRLLTRHKAGFSIKIGSDIRTIWCKNFMLDLRAGWTAHVVLVNGNKKSPRFQLRFANTSSKTWSGTAPTKAKSGTVPSGFEFRVMDNMPLETMRKVFKLCILVAAASEKSFGAKKDSCSIPAGDNEWLTMVSDVLVMGAHAPVGGKYIAKLYAQLGLQRPRTHPRHTLTARSALVDLCARLYAAYSKHPWVALMVPGNSALEAFVPDDINTLGWREAFARSPHSHLTDFTDTAAWAHDLPYLRAESFMISPSPGSLTSLG